MKQSSCKIGFCQVLRPLIRPLPRYCSRRLWKSSFTRCCTIGACSADCMSLSTASMAAPSPLSSCTTHPHRFCFRLDEGVLLAVPVTLPSCVSTRATSIYRIEDGLELLGAPRQECVHLAVVQHHLLDDRCEGPCCASMPCFKCAMQAPSELRTLAGCCTHAGDAVTPATTGADCRCAPCRRHSAPGSQLRRRDASSSGR